MNWLIDYTDDAIKALAKLDKPIRNRITKFLNVTLLAHDNPRQTGKALQGTELGCYWRYTVGDYRVICEIIDSEITVLVIDTDHRSKIYKSH
jgi:mRNA interferase RelE/StbE